MPNWDKYPNTQKHARKEREWWKWRSVVEAVDLRGGDEGECGDVPHYGVGPHIRHGLP